MAESVGRAGPPGSYQLPNAWARGSGNTGVLSVLGGKLESAGPLLTLRDGEATRKFQRKEGPRAPLVQPKPESSLFTHFSNPGQGLENLDANARRAGELTPWTSTGYHLSSSVPPLPCLSVQVHGPLLEPSQPPLPAQTESRVQNMLQGRPVIRPRATGKRLEAGDGKSQGQRKVGASSVPHPEAGSAA